MSKQEYIWKNGQFIVKEKAVVSVMTHALHYGSAVFEGIRAYDTLNGTAILKLKEHLQRFLYSMTTLGMATPYTINEICQAVIDTVKKNGYKSCYIRPLAFYGNNGNIGVLPSLDHPVEMIIWCLPMEKYLAAETVDIKISKYIRIHPKSTVCDAKISGHYVNSMLAGLQIRNTEYHEVLLLDIDGNVAEGAAQNIFYVKNSQIFTTPLGTILDGITRKLVIEIAKEKGYSIYEKYFKVAELMRADEAFFSGTATEITPIRSIDNQKISDGKKIGSITQSIKEHFTDIVTGKIPSSFLTYIN